MLRSISLLFLLICSLATAQPPGAPAPASAPRATTLGAKSVHFEVASIRRNKNGIHAGNGVTADGYNVQNIPTVILVSMAFGVLDFQRIQGLPDWCAFGSEGYDIDAKVADSDVPAWKKQDPTEFRDALRSLLEDRFHLKAHFETRDAPAYALVVAKNGPKFKPATPGETYPNGRHDREGKPMLGIYGKFEPGSDDGHLLGQAASMEALAGYLTVQPVLGRPVVDHTGLTGTYDFSMPIQGVWGTNRQPADSEVSIFTVIQDSLGLKLEPAKAPVQFLVIDHIERPSEN
jgi:uncharacterized protein (TIGR03435 family)